MSEKLPKVVVGVLVYNEQGQVFLASAPKWKGKWIVPGGHLEWGETLVQCASREMKEETNLEISDIELLEVQESICSQEHFEERHWIFMDYIARATTEDVRLNDELEEYVWIDPAKALEELDLNKSTRHFIETFISKKLS